MQCQGIAAEAFRFRRFGQFEGSENISFEVRPTVLQPALVIFRIAGATITAQDARKRPAQQRDQHFSLARGGDFEHDIHLGDQHP
jgi:hypothetical protein